MKNMSLKPIFRMIVALLFVGLAISIFPVSAAIFTEDGTELDESALITYLEEPAPEFETPLVIYFYDPNCGGCMQIHDFWDTYLNENPDVTIEQVNLEEGPEQMDRFKKFAEAYHREKAFIPLVYIGPVSLEGADDIRNYFDKVYSWYMASYKGE